MSSAAEYWVGPTIGEGSFGHVVYAVHKATKRKVAIKVMEVPVTSVGHHRQSQLKQKTSMILNERKILSLPELKSSRWIVNLWAAFCDTTLSSRYLYFVMELATGGDLAGLIQRALCSSDCYHWRTSSTPYYASQLISAVDFLHSQDIIHTDLKPENVLLSTTGDLRLADFGCAIEITKQQPTTQTTLTRGTARYASPELLRASCPSSLTFAVDYWSIGCVLHAMWNGQSPFDRGSEALTTSAIFQRINCDTDGSAGEFLDPWPPATRNDRHEDHILEASKNTDPTKATIVSKTCSKSDGNVRNSLQVISQHLLASIPDDRISAWKKHALPYLALLSNDCNGTCEEVPTPTNDGCQQSSARKNIVLPAPHWQYGVANATLRDGKLGWCVFQI